MKIFRRSFPSTGVRAQGDSEGEGRKHLEEDIPAEQHLQEEDTRIPAQDENPVRTPDPEEEAGQGKETSGGLSVAATGLRFPRDVRLRSRSDYLRVQRSGKSFRDRHIILVYLSNGLPHTRFGLTVSRRIGNAVARNHLKRRIREIQRKNRHRLKPGYDLVVIARPRARHARYQDLDTEYRALIGRAGLERKEGEA